MAVSLKKGGLIVGTLMPTDLTFEVDIEAPGFWKLPYLQMRDAAVLESQWSIL